MPSVLASSHGGLLRTGHPRLTRIVLEAVECIAPAGHTLDNLISPTVTFCDVARFRAIGGGP